MFAARKVGLALLLESTANGAPTLPVKSATTETLDRLRRFESRNVTFIDPDGSWPIVWEKARGCHVWDADGKRYLDLTAAFGVAAAGHANARVVAAGRRQMGKLLHAMGDVHPHALKANLARALSRITFERWSRASKREGGKDFEQRPDQPFHASTLPRAKTIFCNSGFEAVEAALKTALLATGRAGIIAFEGAYHGLGYGTLSATHRDIFRSPFKSQLGRFGRFAPFPYDESALPELEAKLRQFLTASRIGAILVEPIQARGGIRIPPPGLLPLLRRLCDEHGALLILDEIYTGFGRTGRWFACEHVGVIPDIICLGKALTGGFPLSACVGLTEWMDAAWPVSSGEAIHTSTFLGHPVGCAMALAQISEINRLELIAHSARVGRFLMEILDGALRLCGSTARSRGLGLMVGIEFFTARGAPASAATIALIKRLLARGLILLPEGEHGNVLSFTPPLTIRERDLSRALRLITDELRTLVGADLA